MALIGPRTLLPRLSCIDTSRQGNDGRKERRIKLKVYFGIDCLSRSAQSLPSIFYIRNLLGHFMVIGVRSFSGNREEACNPDHAIDSDDDVIDYSWH